MPDGGPDPNIIKKTYTIDVITPLFGGGYEAGKVDPDMPIRASSIRGHLRFWWRATRGAKFDTVEELRQREGEIWGSMENPSPVGIEVSDIQMGKKKPCAYYRWRQRYNGMWRWALEWANEFDVANRSLPYVLFPFQGKMPDRDDEDRGERPQTEAYLSGQFTLIVKYPRAEKMAVYRSVYNEQRKKKNINPLSPDGDDDAIDDDVTTAIRAWVNFGGIGARTRRGCGAIYCKDLAPKQQDKIGNWYLSNFTIEKINPAIKRRWPVLPDKILIKNGNSVDALQCWSGVIGLLQTFRQGKNIGRDPGNSSSRPGRSRWPEPESIRRITGDRARKYQRMEHIPDKAAFPRAEFGLPIVFNLPAQGDPGTLELYPVVGGSEKTRMASPLILRPLKCSNGIFTQLILQLNATPVQKVVLKRERRALQSSTTIHGTHLATYRNSPMASRSGEGSALDAFLAYAKEGLQGFKEVP